MDVKKKIRLFQEFGPLVGFASACSSAIRFPMAVTRWKDRCIVRYLKENYGSSLLKWQGVHTPPAAEGESESAPIWSVWWQGEENAPEMVRLCFASVNRHRGAHPFTIVTKDNYREYIQLPEYIIEKVQSGVLRLTHLSDIIRVCLLYHHGGLWLDSTIFAANAIPKDIFRSEYYSIKTGFDRKCYAVPQGRWSSFFQAARKGSPLCGAALDIQLKYWERQSSLIDYIFVDYAYELAYEELPECKRLLDSVPVNNCGVESLRPLLSSPWNAETFKKLTADTRFFKLTWKHPFNKMRDGRETFYGYLTRSLLG